MLDSLLDHHKRSSNQVEFGGRARQRARRNWTIEAKGRLVAAMLAPGANVSEIARKNEISRQHLYLWRRAALKGTLPLPTMGNGRDPATVDVVRAPSRAKSRSPAPAVEIEVAGFLLRVYPDTDPDFLANLVHALKDSR